MKKMTVAEIEAYVEGAQDTRRELLTPYFYGYRELLVPWRVGVVCRVFGAWSGLSMHEKEAETLTVGGWQAVQERLMFAAASEVVKAVRS